jgi:hypothetical protein
VWNLNGTNDATKQKIAQVPEAAEACGDLMY